MTPPTAAAGAVATATYRCSCCWRRRRRDSLLLLLLALLLHRRADGVEHLGDGHHAGGDALRICRRQPPPKLGLKLVCSAGEGGRAAGWVAASRGTLPAGGHGLQCQHAQPSSPFQQHPANWTPPSLPLPPTRVPANELGAKPPALLFWAVGACRGGGGGGRTAHVGPGGSGPAGGAGAFPAVPLVQASAAAGGVAAPHRRATPAAAPPEGRSLPAVSRARLRRQ